MTLPATSRSFTLICCGLGLALAAAAVVAGPHVGSATARDVKVGNTAAFKTIGDLPVMHRGRVKPLFSMAIDEVKSIHGSSAITLCSKDRTTIANWEPVAALLDWSAQPEFWDDQDFILVEYRPLYRLLVPSSIRGHTPDREWVSPRELEGAVVEREGRTLTFSQWVLEIEDRRLRSSSHREAAIPQLTPIEENAAKVGERLFHYKAIRDHKSPASQPLDLLVVPRPVHDIYLKYSAEAFEKGMKPEETLSPLESDVAAILVEYLEGIEKKDWALPGEDAVFDQSFKVWLSLKGRWLPLGVILQSDESELSRVGMPMKQALALRQSFMDLEHAERSAPGDPPEELAAAVIAAARVLGSNLSKYPQSAAMAHESQLIRFSPFSKAATAYGIGVVLLVFGFRFADDPRAPGRKLRTASSGLGVAAVITGMSLLFYGLCLRFRVSHRIPVTNLYETVLSFALITTVLGLLLELLCRRKYFALASSGIALIATVLAVNLFPFNPEFSLSLPELRTNRWLLGHVAPIVGSYAAFALALALGLLMVNFYLTASFRRSPSYRELAAPLLPGVPLYLLGRFATEPWSQLFPPSVCDPRLLGYVRWGLAGAGGILTIMGAFSVLGELANRFPRRATALGLALATLGLAPLIAATAGTFDGALEASLTTCEAWIVVLIGGALIAMGVQGAETPEALAHMQPVAGIIYGLMLIGVLGLAVGTIAGAAWAYDTSHGFSAWDPKVVWSVITLLVYLIPVLGRSVGRFKNFALVSTPVVCSSAVLMLWFGLNVPFRAGLHDYGFTEAAGQQAVPAYLVVVLGFVGAAAWRRFRSQ